MILHNNRARLRILLATTLLCQLAVARLSAGTVRISFLDEEPVLRDTCHLLEQTGCSQEALSTYRKLVTHHNKVGRPVDRTKFPAPQEGFYEFRDVDDLASRLPYPLSQRGSGQPPAPFTLMCFDVASLLLHGAGCETPRLEQDFESKGMLVCFPDGAARLVGYKDFWASTYHLICPEKLYVSLTGRPRTEAETCLELSLVTAHVLAGTDPQNTKNLAGSFSTYFNSLKRSGFNIPADFKLGLVSFVNFEQHFIKAVHAFLCLRQGQRLVCVEKVSGTGPYVRAEFTSEEDLSLYQSMGSVRFPVPPGEFGYNWPVAVTLNDKLTGLYHPAALNENTGAKAEVAPILRPNPEAGANGRRPFSSETDPTPATATEASTNAPTEFKLLSLTPAAQVSSAPASGAQTGSVLHLPTVEVTYSGISATWAHRLGRVLTEARSHAQREFGFDMPDIIRLTVTVGSNRFELFNDTRDQLTYHLRSEGDLAGFDFNHWYFLYGMCHEVAHLAMYRTFNPRLGNGWLNWDGQEAWAHYLAERLADMSYSQCVSEFWPGRRPEGELALKADRQSAQNLFPLSERQLAEHWRALADIVGDLGIEPLFETWNKATIDPQHAADAVARTFIGHPKAEPLRRWWLKASPPMLTGPGKSVFPPTGRPNPSSGRQPKTKKRVSQ